MSLANPPTPADPTKLFDLATLVLEACEQALTDAGLVVPPLAYLFGGATPVGACEQLAVGWGWIGQGVPSMVVAPAPDKGQATPRRCSIPVWCFRELQCALAGEGVELQTFDTTAAQADAQVIMSDAYTLHKGLVVARNAGMFGSATGSAIVIDDFVPLANSGQLGGCRGGVIIELS